LLDTLKNSFNKKFVNRFVKAILKDKKPVVKLCLWLGMDWDSVGYRAILKRGEVA
jgi:hypothetical protein